MEDAFFGFETKAVGNGGERSAYADVEVLFQAGRGNKLKLELQTRSERALLLDFRSLSILLPDRYCGGKGLGFLAC